MQRCHSCDIEITSNALKVAGSVYCCRGCAEGGPCNCTYEDRAGSLPRNGHANSVFVLEVLGKELVLRADDPESPT